MVLNYLIITFFFCSPRPCYCSTLLKDCLGTDCTKKSADAVLCQCCNSCFHFSPYVVRINHLYYSKHFGSLFLYHILDFDFNSSGFQKRVFTTQQVLMQNFAMCSMVTCPWVNFAAAAALSLNTHKGLQYHKVTCPYRM